MKVKNMKVKTEYFINDRVVVCVLTTENEVLDRLQKYGLATEFFPYETDVRKYRGIAKCAPEDKYDLEYGRKLAEYRATCKRQKDVNRAISKYMEKERYKLDTLARYGTLKTPTPPPMPKED